MKSTILALSFICVALNAGEEIAWERKALENCHKENEDCQRKVDKCQEDSDKCWESAGQCESPTKCQKKEARCAKDEDNCKRTSDTCQYHNDKCKEAAPQKDEAAFVSELSSYYRTLYNKLTPEQKKKAMDLADHNKMTPDKAIDKVMGKK